ncbi:MAG TPA: adenylosuccinate synthase [Phycisphaerales bacterium]|nr:adenylosuccinate synthase [Phycisphaerales bacterium]
MASTARRDVPATGTPGRSAAPTPQAGRAAGAGPGPGSCAAVVGMQWGDEGKGKIVDLLAPGFAAVVRYNGGANAGHSVVVKGERYALHLIPSGILFPGALAVIGNGVVVDPEALLAEADGLAQRGVDVSGLVVSDRAHVVMPYHKAEDELREARLGAGGADGAAGRPLGTTKRGIGPCYADKAQRAAAIRMGDLLEPDLLRRKLGTACALKNALLGGLGGTTAFDPDQLTDWALAQGRRLAPCIRDTTYLLHELRERGESILFEGANATLLDVDHGTYPYVTSSSCTALGIPAGTGVPGQALGTVIGVVKAYSTRVGNGPMPTELHDATATHIRERGREYGTTTGRPRRVGWLDLVAVRYSALISGTTSLAVTLLDVLAGLPELKVATAYRLAGGQTTDRFIPDGERLARVEPVYTTLAGFPDQITAARARADLPRSARDYLDLIEDFVGVKIGLVGVGPDRAQTIRCD